MSGRLTIEGDMGLAMKQQYVLVEVLVEQQFEMSARPNVRNVLSSAGWSASRSRAGR